MNGRERVGADGELVEEFVDPDKPDEQILVAVVEGVEVAAVRLSSISTADLEEREQFPEALAVYAQHDAAADVRPSAEGRNHRGPPKRVLRLTPGGSQGRAPGGAAPSPPPRNRNRPRPALSPVSVPAQVLRFPAARTHGVAARVQA